MIWLSNPQEWHLCSSEVPGPVACSCHMPVKRLPQTSHLLGPLQKLENIQTNTQILQKYACVCVYIIYMCVCVFKYSVYSYIIHIHNLCVCACIHQRFKELNKKGRRRVKNSFCCCFFWGVSFFDDFLPGTICIHLPCIRNSLELEPLHCGNKNTLSL